jgi:hypothetical protein
MKGPAFAASLPHPLAAPARCETAARGGATPRRAAAARRPPSVAVVLRLAVALCLAVPAAVPAAAQEPSFRLVNGGSVPIVEVRASPAVDPTWGPNRLAGRVLLPGGSVVVQLPPGQCVVDVRVVYATGQAQERRAVNTCPILEMVFP